MGGDPREDETSMKAIPVWFPLPLWDGMKKLLVGGGCMLLAMDMQQGQAIRKRSIPRWNHWVAIFYLVWDVIQTPAELENVARMSG